MTTLLLLKLTLVPLLIVLITLAGRRWGAAVAGALAAFPVVAGPILFFVAIEQSNAFAAKAAAAAILGVLANVAFGVAYSWTSRRLSWMLSLLTGWIAYFAVVALYQAFVLSATQAAAITVVGLMMAGRFYPHAAMEAAAASKASSDLPYRVIAALALVLGVTIFSTQLGPKLAGMLAVFPVMGSVLAVFSHVNVGRFFAVRLLHGMVRGFYAFTLFCWVLAAMLEQHGLAVSFVAALTGATLVQVVFMRAGAQSIKPPAAARP